MLKTIMVEIPQQVTVRKYDIDQDGLVRLLRSHKTMTNKAMADALGIPKTMVEHWFRTDKYFAVPEPDIWFDLKELLAIKDGSYDIPITTFEVRDGCFDSAERHYCSWGVMPNNY